MSSQTKEILSSVEKKWREETGMTYTEWSNFKDSIISAENNGATITFKFKAGELPTVKVKCKQ